MPKWVCNQTFAILGGSPKFLADKFKIATNTLLRLPCSPFVLNLKHFLREQVDSFTNHVVTKPHTYFPMLYQIYKQCFEKEDIYNSGQKAIYVSTNAIVNLL